MAADPRTHRRYRRLRERVLAEEPLCRGCLQDGRHVASREVDHIQPIEHRPDLAMRRDNLQGLCTDCHRRKTRRQRRQPPPRLHVDGWPVE